MDEKGTLLGMATVGHLLSRIAKGQVKPTDPVEGASLRFDRCVAELHVLSKRALRAFAAVLNVCGSSFLDSCAPSLLCRHHDFVEITEDTKLADLTGFFEKHSVGIVTDHGHKHVKKVVTQVDLLHYMVQQQS